MHKETIAKTVLLALFSVLLCFCTGYLAFTATAYHAKAAEALDITDRFDTADVIESTENETAVYTFKDTGLKYLKSDIGSVSALEQYNTVSFSVKWNGEQSNDSGRNLSVWLKRTLNGDEKWVQFKFNPLDSGEKGLAAVLAHYNNGSAGDFAGTVFVNWSPYTQDTVNTDAWYDFSVAFEEKDGATYCKIFCNNEEKAEFVDSSGGTYSLGGFMFTSFGLKSSVKEIRLGYTACAPAETPLFAGGIKTTETEGEEIIDVYTLERNSGGVNAMSYTGDTAEINTISFDIKMSEFGDGCMTDLFIYSNEYPDNADQALRFNFQPYWAYLAVRGMPDFNTERAVVNYVENLNDEQGLTPSNPSYGWMHFSCSFMRGYASYTVSYETTAGGEPVMREYRRETALPEGYTFTGTKVLFQTYYMAAQVKNFVCENGTVTIDKEWVGVEDTNGVYNFPEAEGITKLSRIGTTGKDGSGNFNNALFFDIRPNSYAADNNADENAGVMVHTDARNGSYLFAEFLPHTNSFRLRIFDGDKTFTLGMGSYTGKKTDWLHAKILFAEDFVAVFVSDEEEKTDGAYDYKLAVSSFDTQGYSFDDVSIEISAWKSAPSVKNMQIRYEKPDYTAAGYMDLDFTDSRGLNAIKESERYSFTYNENQKAVDFEVETADPSVNITMNQSAGSRYSAYLPVRNTVLLRLKNNTSSKELKVDFKTTANEQEHEKVFEISNEDEEYKTYYLNLSDTKAGGYLKELTLTLSGAAAGETFSIEAISFEREDALYAWAATEEIRCTADKAENLVTVSGKVNLKYAGKRVYVIESLAENYLENLNGAKLGNAPVASDGSFTVTFPYKKGYKDMTHLSSYFLAYVQDGNNNIKLSHAFSIANYAELAGMEDKDPTNINGGNVFTVTDSAFGAKGDGYTDDTLAIQAAIDRANAAGGGTVVVPGDASEYGKRYIVTNLVLKDNVELRIEKGAVLWQSSRIADYENPAKINHYTPALGHDAADTSAMWAHNGFVSNYPLIQITNCNNVKIAGGGMVRMSDIGNEWTDAGDCWTVKNGHSMLLGCSGRIHLTPIGISGSSNITVSDIEVRRSSSYHMIIRASHHVLIQNVNNREAVCQNTDGFSIQNSHHVTLLCNSNHSNDDSIVLWSSYRDERDRDDWWWIAHKDGDASVHDILLVGNAVYGGLGLVFIPWGSESPDLSKTEIYNIVAYDNIFAGGQSVGCWPDNPNYGYRKLANYNVYNDVEYGDYSPIRDVWLHDNKYPQFAGLEFEPSKNKVVADATNFISDAGITGASDFVNASFERELRYENEQDFVSGLSYWSSALGEQGLTGYEEVGVKTKAVKFTADGQPNGKELQVKDYAGYAAGNAKLYQGLYLKKGYYEFSIRVKNPENSASLFVAKSEYGALGNSVANKKLDASDDFTLQKLRFRVQETGYYAVGITNEGDAAVKAYIDDASIVQKTDPDAYTVNGDLHEFGFEEHFTVTGGNGVSISGSELETDADGDYRILLKNRGTLTEFDVSIEMAMFNESPMSAGFLILSGTEKGYSVQIDKPANSNDCTVVVYSYENGTFTKTSFNSFGFTLSDDRVALRLVSKGGNTYLFLNGEEEPSFTYVGLGLKGNVGLRSNYSESLFENFKLISDQYLSPQKAESLALAALLSEAKEYSENEYTAESFAVLKAAIERAENLSLNASEEDLIAAQTQLESAISGLQKKTAENPYPGGSADPENPGSESPDKDPTSGGCSGSAIESGAAVSLSVLAAGTVIIAARKRKKQ